MRKISTTILLFTSIIPILSGCAQNPTNPYLTQRESIHHNPAQHETLILEAPVNTVFRDDLAYSHQSAPWWASRNDERLNLTQNANEFAYEQGFILIYDRQFSHGDHSHNYYRRTGISRRIR